jgi:hypothetical protein
MLTYIKNQNLVFTMDDVDDAVWLINTDEKLNHGVEPMLWAWKVVMWYLNLYKELTYFYTLSVKNGIATTVQDVWDYVMRLVTSNKLLI